MRKENIQTRKRKPKTPKTMTSAGGTGRGQNVPLPGTDLGSCTSGMTPSSLSASELNSSRKREVVLDPLAHTGLAFSTSSPVGSGSLLFLYLYFSLFIFTDFLKEETLLFLIKSSWFLLNQNSLKPSSQLWLFGFCRIPVSSSAREQDQNLDLDLDLGLDQGLDLDLNLCTSSMKTIPSAQRACRQSCFGVHFPKHEATSPDKNWTSVPPGLLNHWTTGSKDHWTTWGFTRKLHRPLFGSL